MNSKREKYSNLVYLERKRVQRLCVPQHRIERIVEKESVKGREKGEGEEEGKRERVCDRKRGSV